VRLSTKLTGIVAVGGVAALGAGLISSGGIGAAFTDSATATANINVGDFGCSIDVLGDGQAAGDSVTVDLGRIDGSLPGQKTATVNVTNDGTIPMVVVWSAKATGDFFASGAVNSSVIPITNYQNWSLTAGATGTYTIGAKWGELDNNALTRTGSVTYTADCVEASAATHNLFVATKLQADASWTDGGLNYDLSADPNYTAVNTSLTDVNGTNLPAVEPSIHANNGSVKMPKWVITLPDGTTFGGNAGPVGSGTDGRWFVNPGTGPAPVGISLNAQKTAYISPTNSIYWTWQQITDTWGDPQVATAELVAFGTSGMNVTIDCASYQGFDYISNTAGTCNWS